MGDNEKPTWLKIMEHGSVGEARTKAFLLDRFWVLERSVDIDGADFLVQPRAIATRFTDRSPPKIGVIQAKYFQDRRTAHQIPRNYVVDEHGFPLKGFFALLHVGEADDAQAYLLSSADMIADLDLTAEEPKRFIVGTKALVDKFRIDKHRRQALDRIAHEIEARTAFESVRFLDRVHVPFRQITTDDVDYRYKLPIPNSQADIPKIYYEYRDRLRSLIFEIEEGLTIIDTILQAQNPHVGLAELEKLEDYRSGRPGAYDGLIFSTRKLDLDWPYLLDALEEHDERVDALEKIDKLKLFVDLSYAVSKEMEQKAAKLTGDNYEGQYLYAKGEYDLKTLECKNLQLTVVAKEPIKSKSPTAQSVYLRAAKGEVDILKAADTLRHVVMTRILLTLCPALDIADD